MPPIDQSPRAGHQPSQPVAPEPTPGRSGGDPGGGAPKEGAGHGSAPADPHEIDPVTGAGEDIAG